MGKSAPKPDPMIAQAAMKSAETGERYLSWMQDLSKVTQGWAEEDRARYKKIFEPMETRLTADAQGYASPERKAMMAEEAIADVRQQSAIGRQTRQRQQAATGVRPDSGRFAGEERRAGTAEALGAAGAGNTARRQVEAVGDQKVASVVNMGRGMAVNPGTSMGMTGNMGSAGFQGAMSGYGQQGQLMLGEHDAQMRAHNANQATMGGIGGAFGSIVGALAFPSSEGIKTKKKPISVLDAVKDMPVEEWEYKAGKGDGGGKRHVGPYAEDFKAKTGLGDGKSISIIDAVGVNMGATKELAAQVDRLASKLDGKKVKEAA